MLCEFHFYLKNKKWDFPCDPVVKTLPPKADGEGLIPGRRAKLPHATQPRNKNIKQKQYCNKFNEDLKKKGTHKKNF